MQQLTINLLDATSSEKVTNFGIWWLIGFILTIAIGMLVYVLIKKNPRKDAND